jgi:MFS family permease
VSLYVFARDLGSFYGLALMFGFSYGAVMPLYAIIAPEYFGARITGTMFGPVNMASTLGMALDPWAGGWLYDVYGSYFWLRSASVSAPSQSPSPSARLESFRRHCRARASRKGQSSSGRAALAVRGRFYPSPGPRYSFAAHHAPNAFRHDRPLAIYSDFVPGG